MILSPEQYPQTSTRDLLLAAARGQVGIDHRWLRAILDRSPEVFEDIHRFVLEDGAADRVGIDAVLLDVVRHVRDPRTVPILIAYARLVEFDMPDELIKAFRGAGEAAIEPLLALYKEAGEHTPDVTFALGALGVRDQRIFDVLVADLERQPLEAAIALSVYGDPATEPALQAALEKTTDELVRHEIEAAIQSVRMNQEPEPPESFDVFEEFPEEAEPRFGALTSEELMEFLDSPVASYRALAAAAMGFDELTEERRKRLLEMAHKDPDPAVRGACWEALESAAEDEDVSLALQARFEDDDVPVEERGGVLVALAQTAREDAAVRRAILHHADVPGGRAQAVKAMWHSMDRRFADTVAKYLADPDLDVRRQAISAVGWLGVVSQLSKVEQAMQDEGVRDAALYAYVLAAPGETSPAHLRKLFRRVEELAGGLSDDEGMIVRKALDDRLEMNGQEPVFLQEEGEAWQEDEPAPAEPAPVPAKVGRNDPCPCGSGKKYKKCCGK